MWRDSNRTIQDGFIHFCVYRTPQHSLDEKIPGHPSSPAVLYCPESSENFVDRARVSLVLVVVVMYRVGFFFTKNMRFSRLFSEEIF